MSQSPSPVRGRRGRIAAIALRAARKTLWMLLVLWGITLISFWVIHLAPGSPTDMETTLNPLAGEAARQGWKRSTAWIAPSIFSTGTGCCACCILISAIPCPRTRGPCWTKFWSACP